MAFNERFLIVVSLLEGRHFPRRSNHQFLIETKLDGENLGTDPIPHSTTPIINTELAWEIDRKRLHHYKLQRTPLKLQCYAVNTVMKTREMIGYVMLDFRMATQLASSPGKYPVASKWYPLVSCKYQQLKPEIKVAVTLEADNIDQADNLKIQCQPQKQQETSEFQYYSRQAILNEAEGIFQIGPSHCCNEIFIMSVTIAFATNLIQLLPRSQQFSHGNCDVFFFYYSLLGQDVTNEHFKDLLSPTFASERASVKIRSSLEALDIFFQENSKLEVHLCNRNQSLGSCGISLSSLVQSIPQLDTIPALLEGAFQLHSPKFVSVSAQNAPKVGVSVMLKKEIYLAEADSETLSSIGSSLAIPKQPDSRDSNEYKVAIELEMWKWQEAGEFEYQLKEKELSYMQTLTEEWKKRDKHREAHVKNKIKEYAQLESKLHLALNDIQLRETRLATNELELDELKSEVQREHGKQLSEIKEMSRKIKEDFIHQIELEKSKVKNLENEKQQLVDQLDETKKLLHQNDIEFMQYKQQVTKKPEVILLSEINLLKLEKVELERKLESLTKSKVHYKQQWGHALKELAHHKQKEQTEASVRLKQQQHQLEHMKVRYLAAEEKEMVKSENQHLKNIKQQLKKLKPSDPGLHATSYNTTLSKSDSSKQQPIDNHVARLVEERDTLLHTGVYTWHDKIISELDRQIQHHLPQVSFK